MLLNTINEILITAFLAFTWSCIAGLALVATEKGGLLHEFRNKLVAKKSSLSDETLQYIAERNKFAKFLTCQICFTSHLSIYIAIGLYLLASFAIVQCLGFIAFSYYFSQKV
jgi:hypothetical protein